MIVSHFRARTLYSLSFLFGLVIDDVRVVLLGLGCQASKASAPKGGNLTQIELALTSPMTRSFHLSGPDSPLQA